MGLVIVGKSFCACEDLREIARQFKGWTVEKVIRYLRLIEAEKKQFGVEE